MTEAKHIRSEEESVEVLGEQHGWEHNMAGSWAEVSGSPQSTVGSKVVGNRQG